VSVDLSFPRRTLHLRVWEVRAGRVMLYLLDANDSFVSTVVFKNGAIGTIHSSRWASGHHNSLRARVYGDEGARGVGSLDESRQVAHVEAGIRRRLEPQQEKSSFHYRAPRTHSTVPSIILSIEKLSSSPYSKDTIFP